MRSFILPLGLLVCGTLAALPFRRSPSTVPELRRPENTRSPVSPLSERDGTSVSDQPIDADTAARWAALGSSARGDARDPFAASQLQLPGSYDEVAVPLAIDPERDNLLSPRKDAPRPHREHGLSRYGIPLEAYAAHGRAPDQNDSPASLRRTWSSPQPLRASAVQPDRGAAPDELAADPPRHVVSEPSPADVAADRQREARGVRSKQPSQPAGGTAPRGRFQMTSQSSAESVTAATDSTGETSGRETSGRDAPQRAPAGGETEGLPAPRDRHFIREPA